MSFLKVTKLFLKQHHVEFSSPQGNKSLCQDAQSQDISQDQP